MSMIVNIFMKKFKAQHIEETKLIGREANARVKEMKAENPEVPRSFRQHTDTCIYPAIAIYQAACRYGVEAEKAIDIISDCFNAPCEKYAAFLNFGIRLFHLVHKVPAIFVKSSLKNFAPNKNGEYGFAYRFPEEQDPRVARFDITSCPYLRFCEKYHCPEVMRAFCDSDDHKYSNLHKDLLWDRTGTIGKGSDCCDFRLVDIGSYPDYKRQNV